MIASLGMIVLNYLRCTELTALFYSLIYIVLGDMQNCGSEIIYSGSGLSHHSGFESSSGSNSEIKPCKKVSTVYAMLWIQTRIDLSPLDRDLNPDPGGQKLPTKKEKSK
jgi:hypothetical protein